MEYNLRPTIGCAIITHNARKHIERCLNPLLQSKNKIRILVVNSSSNDGTIEIAKSLGVETLVIPRDEFNHGTTRERARKYLGTDIIGMLTPDAYFVDDEAFHRLIEPINNNHASIAYARQIPHKGSNFFESFAREYNYPEKSHIRSLSDHHLYGIYTFFCSDSCAAYSNSALDEIGGFQDVLLGEDTVATASLLRRGHKIAYVAEAEVYHSHGYSLLEEFKRNFDIGIARKGYAHLLKCESSDSKRGMDYCQLMIRRLTKESPHYLPYAFAHIFAKWLGYTVGKYSTNAPIWWKKMLSMQDFFWNSRKH